MFWLGRVRLLEFDLDWDGVSRYGYGETFLFVNLWYKATSLCL